MTEILLLVSILGAVTFNIFMVMGRLENMEAQRGADLEVDRAEIRRLSLKINRIVRES
jgi:hypothetical protein